jgi:hypothetical protein
LTWVLESGVFPVSHEGLRIAIQQRGEKILDWQDDWVTNDGLPALSGSPAVFHGSLGNAAMIASRNLWCPGAYCAVPKFCCSAWYEDARSWLLHRKWHILPADEFVQRADAVFDSIGAADRAFVRPDSPLKPFSGRVVSRDRATLAALDHGFYYEDTTIPVVVAPICENGHEWRFIIVRRTVVAGSAYDPQTRRAVNELASSGAWEFAAHVAGELPPPEDIYVMDLCESAGDLCLLELNPFSGADLYASPAPEIVATVSTVAHETWNSRQSAG